MQDIAHEYSIFEIAGPIMVGPSSSHTAGACKIGQMARALFHHTPEKVTFVLHGSFAEVYKGHSTDRALLGGIMKFKTGDVKIKNSFRIAKQKNIKYEFKKADLGKNMHPNTAKIILKKEGVKPMEIIGCSIGGGVAKIVKIDEFDVDLKAISGYKTFIVWYENDKNILKKLFAKISKKGIKIKDIQSIAVGKKAISIFNIEGGDFTLKEILDLEKMKGIESMRSLLKLPKD